MFDTTTNVVFLQEDSRLPSQEELRDRCLESAALWVLKRRAKLPYLPPQRLPAVARGG